MLAIYPRVGFYTRIQWASSWGHFEWNMIRQEWIRGNNCMKMKFRIKVTKIYAILPLTISCKRDRNASKYHQGWEMIREGRIPGTLCMGQKWRLTINPTESFPNLLESISWQYPQSWFCTRKRCIWRPQRMRNREKECWERNTVDEGSKKSGIDGWAIFSETSTASSPIIYFFAKV